MAIGRCAKGGEQGQSNMDRKTVKAFAWSQTKVDEALWSIMRPPARKAVDARLVKSASRPLSNDELRREREKRERGEADTDKNGNRLKFRRDLDSDWSVPCGM